MIAFACAEVYPKHEDEIELLIAAVVATAGFADIATCAEAVAPKNPRVEAEVEAMLFAPVVLKPPVEDSDPLTTVADEAVTAPLRVVEPEAVSVLNAPVLVVVAPMGVLSIVPPLIT